MGRPARSFWAPGRVNLIGEFTDLVDGLVLPAALDLGIRLDCEPADELRVESPGADPGWTRYVDAVVAELDALGRPPVAIAGTLQSTLPAGAGLSSSAALEVVVALALCAVAEFPLDPLALAQACRRAEHRAVGVPTGILDQAASLLGREGCAILLDTGTLVHEPVPLPPELALVVLHSGVSRRLEGSGYADRKRELEEGHPGRVRHVTTENERVLAVADALRARDLDRLGALFREGHESLRVDFECTTPELDRLVELAYAHGAVAARMTGGGFGGAIVALAERDDAARFADAVLAEYGPRGRAYVCAASAGAREL
ncbi:MAG TPA: galactokinase family protein [Gaiellaceae bacterium]|nr:galactokinase family protein [Gaiellaceae bacterium]